MTALIAWCLFALLPSRGAAFCPLPILSAVQEQDPNIAKGLESFRLRDFAKAEQFFSASVRDNPNRAVGHKLLGMVYAAQEDYRRALGPFRRACELDAREENACYYLGRTLYSLNRFQEARAAFELSLKNPQSRGRPLLGLAMALEALGLPAEAEKRYQEAIGAGEKRAVVDYGLFLHRNGRSRESLEILRKANAKEELDKVLREVSAAAKASTMPVSAVPVRFDASPLAMVVKNGAKGNKHLIETMIAGVALLDFDNDGWLDIFVANGAEVPGLTKTGPEYFNRLFRNLGDGRFADVTEKAGLAGQGYCMGAAAADFDNDGWTDLFVTGVAGNRLYRNRCDGTFADVTNKAGVAGNGTWAVAAAWFDYDSDGWLDLFVVYYVKWDPSDERLCGSREPGYRSYCHPKYYQPLPNALYRNLGDGTFRDVSAESGIAAHKGKGMGIAVGDYDQDGHMDVFVSNDTMANFLFHNEGGGTFSERALEAGVAFNMHGVAVSAMGADFRDLDNDGLEDLFVTAISNEMFPLFRNQGGGLFVDVSGPAQIAGPSLPWSGWSLGAFDFNNDGWKDLFSANGHAVDNVDLTTSTKARQSNTLFVNQGSGRFLMSSLPGEALHRGCAFGDLDRDGRIDAVVTRLNEAPMVLRNVSDNAGGWIRFRLRGTRSNRDAIGAWIEIEAEQGRQWNRVTTSVGYGGSSEPAVHFGLGKVRRVSKAIIRWPSGTVQELKDLEIGRVHEIDEKPEDPRQAPF